MAQRGCGHALFKTRQVMGTVSTRNDAKGDQKLNFVTLAQKYVLLFTPPHMLMTEIAQIPINDITCNVPFPLPQRKHHKCSLIEEGGQRRLHLFILGPLMGYTYLLSHHLLCNTHSSIPSASSGNSKSKLVFVIILSVLLSHLTI